MVSSRGRINLGVGAATALLIVLAMALAAPAMATGKGNGKGKGHTSAYTGSLSLVLLNGDTAPHYGGQVTFSVSSDGYDPTVKLECSQAGTPVYRSYAGFYPAYPWTKNFTLKSTLWTGGAADCSALLYSTNVSGTREYDLATLGFHVNA